MLNPEPIKCEVCTNIIDVQSPYIVIPTQQINYLGNQFPAKFKHISCYPKKCRECDKDLPSNQYTTNLYETFGNIHEHCLNIVLENSITCLKLVSKKLENSDRKVCRVCNEEIEKSKHTHWSNVFGDIHNCCLRKVLNNSDISSNLLVSISKDYVKLTESTINVDIEEKVILDIEIEGKRIKVYGHN